MACALASTIALVLFKNRTSVLDLMSSEINVATECVTVSTSHHLMRQDLLGTILPTSLTVVSSVTGAKFSFLCLWAESKPTPLFLEWRIAESLDQSSDEADMSLVGLSAWGE